MARRSRLSPIGCAAAAAAAATCTLLLLNDVSSPSAVAVVDAFSLAQLAGTQRDDATAATSSSKGGGRSRAAASAPSSSPSSTSSSASLNPLRGSLNSRRRRQRLPVVAASSSTSSSSSSSSNDDFALRASMHSDDLDYSSSSSSSSSSPSRDQQEDTSADNEQQLYERRAFIQGMLTAATSAAVGFTSISADPADAYERSYPIELRSTPTDETENSSNSLTKLNEERLATKRAFVDATRREMRNDPLGINPFSSSNVNFGETIAGASTWALALWFATGSRSNPIVTPLANALYNDEGDEVFEGEDEVGRPDGVLRPKQQQRQQHQQPMPRRPNRNQWLTDRNDGYFSELPPSFMAILSIVYIFLGVLVDRSVYFFVADGDADVSLQLGGVCAIGGAFWEVGRLATMEKPVTRIEADRDVMLYDEFVDFASRRVIVGGPSCTCHRSDVVSAFRRFNPKYRRADDERYPLSDVEIERILKRWNREYGSGREMSSAGFFSGICIDGGADAFAPR